MRKRHEEPKHGIEVVVDVVKWFDHFRWREAIKFWQDRIWSGRFNKGDQREPWTGNAILNIKGWRAGPTIEEYLHIAFNADSGLYEATGHAFPLPIEELRLTSRGKFLSANGNSAEIETVFARFSRDRGVRAIIIRLSDPAHVQSFALANERGQLRIGIQR